MPSSTEYSQPIVKSKKPRSQEAKKRPQQPAIRDSRECHILDDGYAALNLIERQLSESRPARLTILVVTTPLNCADGSNIDKIWTQDARKAATEIDKLTGSTTYQHLSLSVIPSLMDALPRIFYCSPHPMVPL